MSSDELRFAHFRVLRNADGSPHRLGTGSMGVTYKALDERLQLEVALKVISPGRLHDPAAQSLFLREARAAARVRHSNVASVLTLDDTPGQLFYAMEFVPGLTLQALLGERRRLAPWLAVDLALQTARGLEAIHRQGLIHRDLKPANLMLVRAPEECGEDGGERWELKVIDFGLARGLDSELFDPGAARTQGFRGTALYASPEQCLERAELDGRSDLYALGCILCEMLAGRPPFLASSHHEIMSQHVSAPVSPLALGRVPPPLLPILTTLLAKDPAARPASAGALARQLERLLPHLLDLPASAPTEVALPELVRARTGETATADALTIVEPAGSPGTRPRGGSTHAGQRSIAVLAFSNLSSDRENEYFSDGISEELLNALARIPGFRVAARTSSFYFKGRQVAPAEVARQLSVAYLVDGSVRRAGERVRISVQLISAADGFPIWSDTFERELRDVFAVQDEIARIVAENLKLRLSSVGGEAKSVDPEAFRLYLQGLQTLHFRSAQALQQGEALFRRAVQLDPHFSRAKAALASVLVSRADVGFLQDGSWENASLLRAQADRLAEEALALDPTEADALGAQGMAAWSSGDMPEAIRLTRAALALNPSSASHHHLLARALAGGGELAESVRHLRLALTLDPLSPRIIDNCSLMLQYAGHPAEALELAERGLSALPQDPQLTAWRAAALESLGRQAEAVEAAREVVRRGGTWVYYVSCGILRRAGLEREARDILQQAESGPAMSHVFCQAALGHAESAVVRIPEKLGAMFFEELIYPPMWDAVRASPEFQRVLARHGLVEAHARAQAGRVRGIS